MIDADPAAYNVDRYTADRDGLWCCFTVTTNDGETLSTTGDYLQHGAYAWVGCGLGAAISDLGLPPLDEADSNAVARAIERQLFTRPTAVVSIPAGELRIELVEPPSRDVIEAIDELLVDGEGFHWHDAARWSPDGEGQS